MTLVTATLVAQVNAELGNIEYVGSAEIEGDDATAAFLVAPMHCSVTEDSYFTVYIDGSTTLNYVMDYVNGVCTMNTVPTAAQTVSWQFHYKHWTDEQVEDAVELAAQMCFPSFYVSGSETVTADGSSKLYAITGEFVTRLLDSEDTLVRRSRYEVVDSGGTKYLRFYAAPDAEALTAYTVSRPTVGTIDDRAAGPIVSYACYHLVTTEQAPRVRSDIAIVTQGTGVLSPRQMNDAAQAYLMRFQFQLASLRMKPWSSR